MSRWQKLLSRARENPAGLRFDELCGLVERAGFVRRRQKGSHVIYKHPELRGFRTLTLQQGKAGMAKDYQVRQFLAIIEEHGLEIE